MCLWQRWPHYFVILLGLLAFTALRPSLLLILAILMMWVTGGIGFYHAGVEMGIFSGRADAPPHLKSCLSPKG